MIFSKFNKIYIIDTVILSKLIVEKVAKTRVIKISLGTLDFVKFVLLNFWELTEAILCASLSNIELKTVNRGVASKCHNFYFEFWFISTKKCSKSHTYIWKYT